MTHPNEERTRAGLDAFARGDLAALDDLFADDIDWHVPGRSPLAGDYHGKQEVYGFLAKTQELSGGTFRLEVHDVLASDDHVVVLTIGHAERGGTSFTNPGVQVVHFRDGKLAESWFHPLDQYAVDEFWSS